MLLLMCFYFLLATGGFAVVENDHLVQMAAENFGKGEVSFLPDQECYSSAAQLDSATSVCGQAERHS